MNEKFKTLINKALDTNEITLHDIPELDLYMDQIITLVENMLKENKRNPEEKLLTKTMINNYSKARVIKPIKGKKYTKLQIIQILMIYYMKNTLSIEEIKSVLNEHEFEKEELSAVYDEYLGRKEALKTSLPEFLDGVLGDENDPMAALLILTALSDQIKTICEAIIDEYYPQPQKKKG